MKKQSKRILLLVGVCSLLMILSVMAFFQSSMTLTNPFSTGEAKVYLDETFDVDDKWVPGEEKQKEVSFGNEGDVPVVLRARFTPELTLADGTKVTDTNILNGFTLNYAASFASEWAQHDDGWYYYKKVLNPNEKTSQTLVSVTISKNISNDIHGNETDYSGAGMDVDIECEAIQSATSKDSINLQNWDVYPVISGMEVSWIKK
ncbi:BsaA family SipW-dependent biofilm matrix protein [Clostridium perfringens]